MIVLVGHTEKEEKKSREQNSDILFCKRGRWGVTFRYGLSEACMRGRKVKLTKNGIRVFYIQAIRQKKLNGAHSKSLLVHILIVAWIRFSTRKIHYYVLYILRSQACSWKPACIQPASWQRQKGFDTVQPHTRRHVRNFLDLF